MKLLRNWRRLAVVLAAGLVLLVLALMGLKARDGAQAPPERPPQVAGWIRLNPGVSDFTNVVTVPGRPKAVFATTGYSGNHVSFGSVDGGHAWRNLGGRELLAVDPVRPRTLYAWAQGDVTDRVEKSADGGATWRPASRGLPAYVTSIVVDPEQPRVLYASAPTGIFKSTNGGASWFRVGPGPGGNRGQALAIDPARPSTLYAGRSHVESRPGLFKSVDGGRSWRQLRAPWSLDEIAVDTLRPQTLYSWYALEAGSPTAKSMDGGETWTKLSVRAAGFPATDPFLTYHTLATDPSRAETIYLTVSDSADESYVLKSTTGGESWVLVARLHASVGVPELPSETTPVNFTGLAVDPTGRRVYAGTDFGGLFLCTRCWHKTSPANTSRIG